MFSSVDKNVWLATTRRLRCHHRTQHTCAALCPTSADVTLCDRDNGDPSINMYVISVSSASGSGLRLVFEHAVVRQEVWVGGWCVES